MVSYFITKNFLGNIITWTIYIFSKSISILVFFEHLIEWKIAKSKMSRPNKVCGVRICNQRVFRNENDKPGVGHFTNISGHFFAKCINIFHQTEDLTVILKYPTYSNLNWINSTFFCLKATTLY